MSTEHLVVLAAVADAETGVALAQTLVGERLAACVQVIPAGIAVYFWQGQLHTDSQTQLIIKTSQAVWPVLRARLTALHADEVPEILAIPVVDGLPAYLHWLSENTAPIALPGK